MAQNRRSHLSFSCSLRPGWIADDNFPIVWRLQSKIAGSGALGDIGAHSIDLARFLVGEIAGISAVSETFVKRRLTKNRQYARVDVMMLSA